MSTETLYHIAFALLIISCAVMTFLGMKKSGPPSKRKPFSDGEKITLVIAIALMVLAWIIVLIAKANL